MYHVSSADIERRVWKEIRQEEKERKEHNKRVALRKKERARKEAIASGTEKEVHVKAYTRKTKSGKTVTVKAHTTRRKTKTNPSSGGAKTPRGSELKSKRLKSRS